jgi:Co/Zn/Cd efflux system component
MEKATFRISKMDCPSEEQMIRLKFEGLDNVQALEFDIPNRLLHVFHTGSNNEILNELNSLRLDSELLESNLVNYVGPTHSSTGERKILWIVLVINFLFFVIEFSTGFVSNSMGLVADSLDMLADSLVYGLALLAVGSNLLVKKRIAKWAGYFQLALALLGFAEVIRRFVGAELMPDFRIMIIVSLMALVANIFCLWLLQKSKSKEAHMQATMIFTSNDIVINIGVIVAAILVNWLKSGYPDLIIGAFVFLIVSRGAYRILQLSK